MALQAQMRLVIASETEAAIDTMALTVDLHGHVSCLKRGLRLTYRCSMSHGIKGHVGGTICSQLLCRRGHEHIFLCMLYISAPLNLCCADEY